MACQLQEKPGCARARTHTGKTQTKTQYFQQYAQSTTNTNSELFYNASFLNTKDAHLGCIYIYIYFFSGLLLTYFKYISVTTCNCFLDLTASPFIYLHGTSPTCPGFRVAGGRVPILCGVECNSFKHWPENVRLPFQHMEIVTLMPKLPFSAKSCAMLVSKTRQSLFIMAVAIPS